MGATIKKLISLIVPCFNEEEVLPETYDQIRKFLDNYSNHDFEILFVDDGSKDRTRELIEDFSAIDPRVRSVVLSRNFGHQLAVTAGLDASLGDAAILIDADLQDPIELIPEMVNKWEKGFDVVYGVRSQRLGETRFKIATAKLFYRLLNQLSDVQIPLDTGDFRLMDKKVIIALKEMPESQRFIRGMVAWLGFRQVEILYVRAERFAGVSKYPLAKMIKLAIDGLLSFSNKPLKIATHLGALLATFSFIAAVTLVALSLTNTTLVPGWSSTLVSIFFLGGIQLLGLGLLGEYVGRIYVEVKRRPLYLLQNDEKPDSKSDEIS